MRTSRNEDSAKRSSASSGSVSRPGRGLAEKAREKGFTDEELRTAGLTTVRGSDYFPRRLMFPLCDSRGRVVGFQARKLSDDDPLRGKYVNSPEGELFHKGSVLYGLHLAQRAIAKQDRAAIVEGNTDVIALRQAGFEPVVASMGTALTERQLRELRVTRKLFLCFDADAAGQEATLRGMELATARGFDVRVVALPPGQDPADAPDGFEERLLSAESYIVYRVRLELDRASDRQEGFVRAREVLSTAEDSPERQEALRLLQDRLDLPKETVSGLAPARGGAKPPRRPTLRASSTRADASSATRSRPASRIPRSCASSPSSRRSTSTSRSTDASALRSCPAGTIRSSPRLSAELDARAAQDAIDERTGRELLLRLRERKLKRDLGDADLAKTTELHAHLAKVRQALAELT